MINKKPIGDYEIDWNNPLTDGLIGCFMLDDVSFIDLAKHRRGVLVGDGIVQKPLSDGIGITSDSNIGSRINYGVLPASDPLQITSTGAITFISKVNIPSYQFYPRIVDITGNDYGSGWSFILDDNNGKLGVMGGIYSVTEHYSIASVPLNKDVVVAASIDNTGVSYYIDGEFDSKKLANFVFGVANTPLLIGNRGDDYNRQFIGDIHFIYIFNVILSDNIIKNLTDNPYQILKPVRTVSNYATLFGTEAVNDTYNVTSGVQLVGNVLDNDTVLCSV